jgi:hypothetical protein
MSGGGREEEGRRKGGGREEERRRKGGQKGCSFVL